MKDIKKPIAVIPELAKGGLAEVKKVAPIALLAELVEAFEVKIVALVAELVEAIEAAEVRFLSEAEGHLGSAR